MKLYVIPVENRCNGKCPFCITRFKKENQFGEELDIKNLSKIDCLNLDKIEITGGGEPFLHPQMETILRYCIEAAPTQIYTNGLYPSRLSRLDLLYELLFLCISRAHYDDAKNAKLMGIESFDIARFIREDIGVKLSLVLCKSGISSVEDVKAYLNWANEISVKKVVIRQLFDFDPARISEAYHKTIAKEYVSSQELFSKLGIKNYTLDAQGNPIFRWRNMDVEVEFRSCACEVKYPILRGDGNLYLGWTDSLWARQVDEEV